MGSFFYVKISLMFKRIIFIILTSFLIINASSIYADEDIYYVKDVVSEESKSFDDYDDALDYYEDNIKKAQNLLLIENENIIDMNYGVVSFNNDMFEYYSVSRDTKDYLSGTYGKDGAYLYRKKNDVYFYFNGEIGYTDINNVLLVPYEKCSGISMYECFDNTLYHNIKTDLNNSYYSISLPIDNKPEYLDEGKQYYSYDGHYFYDDFKVMIDNYRNNVRTNAINEPYYNYYQYLSHKTITNYSLSEIEYYIYNKLGIDSRLDTYIDKDQDDACDYINKSQLYGEIVNFYNSQYLYGNNALMVLSSAIVESNYGKSLNSYLNNNLFINGAYVDDLEVENQRYNSIENSIYAHNKFYLNKLYSNNNRDDYCGAYFGSDLGGINSKYTLDKYYGEKCASKYFEIDKALGLKDYNSNSIGIILNENRVSFYNDEELDNRRFVLEDICELSLAIIGETDDAYLIQTDNSFNSEYLYNFDYCVAYVKKNAFSYILNKDNNNQIELKEFNYDFNEGSFNDYSSLSINCLNIEDINIKPYKQGYEFVGYELVDDVYVAQYKKIKSIELGKLFNIQKELVPYPNLSNAYINVKYEDGTSNTLSINTDMISKYDLYSNEAQDVYINYNGLDASKKIQIDTSYYESINNINEAINNSDNNIRSKLKNTNYLLSIDDLRRIDSVYKENNKRNYVIVNNSNSEVSLSGLDISLDDLDDFIYVNDTYYVNVYEILDSSLLKLNNIIGNYGFEMVKGVNLSFAFNYQDIELKYPIVVSIKVDELNKDNIYSVYHVDNKGNIIKCKTSQSDNYVSFICLEAGDYEILTRPSFNHYEFEDTKENLSIETMGIDNHKINIEFMVIIALLLIGFIGIVGYYIVSGVKNKAWKDYKKSLLKADTVQEEKPKN